MNEREDSSDQDKTEEASEERRKQFREEGQIANPHEVVSSIAFGILTIALVTNGAKLGANFIEVFHRCWMNLTPAYIQNNGFLAIVYIGIKPLLPFLFMLSAILVVVPLTVGLLLTRFNWAWKKLEFGFEKINPIAGIGRMFGTAGLMQVMKQLIKTIIVSIAIYYVIKKVILESPKDTNVPLQYMAEVIGSSTLKLFITVAISMFVFSVFEWAQNWWSVEQKMKMTKQETKDEIKKHEGDPLVKSMRRRMGRDYVMRRAVSNVSKATFVVTNPEHFAVAIRYVTGMNAPIVVAKGQDFLAQQIKEMAKKHDIAIVENKALARTLYKTVKIGQEIPASLYASIIEVMKYIYQLKGKNYFERFSILNDKIA